ncbi:quercetin dioxygenase-like cupin family protein [Thermocatellispora tengchongensis]|uniref:Quercetin dioxygenase-like cupin family protein n=2 Tax=Thermocatellispora tengchongensis TaxID=1073253 RepID=A0A840PGD8_9ACTN|nr:cupin domain-containing protein [Thermocatellispora tengchongensis]MBB5136550.1 quercetin dioxygenase-like cupin family protein [Thermocatellispora tengchongensis]
MTALAAPSRGSAEISTWRVRMEQGASGPLHTIDREQVWMPLSGVLRAEVAEEVAPVVPEQALVVPAGVPRRFHAPDGPVEILVCMPNGGRASTPGSPEPIEIPWAK